MERPDVIVAAMGDVSEPFGELVGIQEFRKVSLVDALKKSNTKVEVVDRRI